MQAEQQTSPQIGHRSERDDEVSIAIAWAEFAPMILLDSISAKAQPDGWPRRQRKAFGLSIEPFNRDPFERSIPSLRASRAKGNRMRTLVQPPPSTHCDLCGGELRLKQVEPANRTMDLESEIFVCVSCGREISYIVHHEKYAAR
jgi:hypothetical protein